MIVLFMNLLYKYGMLHNVNFSKRDWADTTVIKFIEDPFSEEALAEAIKTHIYLGKISLGNSTAITNGILKEIDADASIPAQEPASLVHAHHMFLDAALLILGNENFRLSRVKFLQRLNNPGSQIRSVNTSKPHLDGIQRGETTPTLRLIGIASNLDPTVILQGPTSHDDFTDKGFLRDGASEEKFIIELLPASQLVLLSPSVLHKRNPSLDITTRRDFLRWQLYL